MAPETMKKTVFTLILVLVAVISLMLISSTASSLETHSANIASLDEKAETVLKLSGTSALVSAGITALPGDAATPIAEKLADFTGYFLVILCVLYAEKYLLTLIGAGVFKWLIPFACGLGIIGVWTRGGGWKRVGTKLAIFGLALYFAIPFSLHISDQIYRVYDTTIETTISEAEELTGNTSALSQSQDESVLSTILDKLSESVASLSNKAVKTLNNFVQSLAIMIVTSCVIPILVVLFLIWLVKVLTNADNLFSLPYLEAWAAPRHHKDDRPRLEPHTPDRKEDSPPPVRL
ncbi:MAG: hypothetical protein IJK14_09330 [Clostridia bacterium]|nr:hypothetical protein [Clostridia bacterium]